MFYHETTASFGSILTSLAFSVISIVSATVVDATPISGSCPAGLDLSPGDSYEGSLAAGEQESLRIELPTSGVLSLALEPISASGVELWVNPDPCSGMSAETGLFTIDRSTHHQRLALTEPGAVILRLAVRGDGSATDYRLDTRFEEAEIRDEWVGLELAGAWYEGIRTSLHRPRVEKIDEEEIDPDPDKTSPGVSYPVSGAVLASRTTLWDDGQSASRESRPGCFDVVASTLDGQRTRATIRWSNADDPVVSTRIDEEEIDPDPDTGAALSGLVDSFGGLATRIDEEEIDPDPDSVTTSSETAAAPAARVVTFSLRAQGDTADPTAPIQWLLGLAWSEIGDGDSNLGQAGDYRLHAYAAVATPRAHTLDPLF